MAVRAKLKGLASLDIPTGEPDLPADPEDCWVRIFASIGADGDETADDFRLVVCTPNRLAAAAEGNYQFGRGLLIVRVFDWILVRQAISRLCEGSSASTWNHVARRLNRYLEWEFEDEVDGR